MAATKIAVVDSGGGNLRSVVRALQFVAPQAEVSICTTPQQVHQAERVVLPGQGAIRDSMAQLRRGGLAEAVLQAAEKKPLLGVCVGMQMLFNGSEEAADVAALGLFPGKVQRFRGLPFKRSLQEPQNVLKVPHMGWNRVRQTTAHPLWDGIPDNSYFYFVHSYHVVPDEPSVSSGYTLYGFDFTCAVAADNIFATQFHPEKSAAVGLRLYRNFIHWNP